MWKTLWSTLRGEYGGRVTGFVFGVVLAVLYLFVGFWDMLIFAFIVYVGYYVGSRIDRRQGAWDWRPVIAWLTERWRGFK